MAKLDIVFVERNGRFESTIFEVSSIACIHIQKKFKGDIKIEQRTGASSMDTPETDVEFDHTHTIPSFIGCKELDILGYVFPKQIRLICNIEPNSNIDHTDVTNNITAYFIAESGQVSPESSEESSEED